MYVIALITFLFSEKSEPGLWFYRKNVTESKQQDKIERH